MTELHGALLLGSVPLGDARSAMTECARALGPHLRCLPDGETGIRTNWIFWQATEVFAKNPGLTMVEHASDPAHWTKGKVTPKEAYGDKHDFVMNPDAQDLEFGELGYAKEARQSYAIFKELKAAGAIAPQMRFQVSLPTPFNIVAGFISDAMQRQRVLAAYEAAMRRELTALCDAVPASDLALQWDCVFEVMAFEGRTKRSKGDVEEDWYATAARLAAAVPAATWMGYHLCYGDRKHTHLLEPESLAVAVRMGNLLAAACGSKLTWLHMPVPKERADAAFFAPLRDLDLGDADLYLGLVHLTDGADGARRRIEAAARVCPRFGIATECGMGRRSTESIRPLLELHRMVLEA